MRHRSHGPSPHVVARRRPARTLASLLLGTVVLLAASDAKAAFGVSPPWVKHDAVMVGTTFFQTLSFSSSAPDEGASFTYALQGCDADLAAWVSVTLPSGAVLQPDELVPWPPGETWLRTVVHVAVPGDASLGARHCDMFSRYCPPAPNGGVGICVGAHVPVDVVVTDQPLVAYATRGASVSPVYVKLGDPVHVQLSVENSGNVDVTTLQVDAKVWPHNLGTSYGGPYTAEGTGNAATPPIPAYQVSPRATREVAFPFTSLPVGTYYLGLTTSNATGVDYQNNLYVAVYTCPPCRGIAEGSGSQCLALPELEGTTCPGGACVAGECRAPDAGAPDSAPDSPLDAGLPDSPPDSPLDAGLPDSPLDVGTPDRALDSARDASALDLGGEAGGVAVPGIDAASSAKLDAPTTTATDGRVAVSDAAATSRDGGSPDLAKADAGATTPRPDGASYRDSASSDAPAVSARTDAGADASTKDAGSLSGDAPWGSVRRPDVGGSGIYTGSGSGSGSAGCSCAVGGAGRTPPLPWLLLAGLLALIWLPRRR